MTYYNTEDPRNTVPLNRSSPRRKLDEECKKGCEPATGLFGGYSKHKSTSGEYPRGEPFETCYYNSKEGKYCWSKSRGIFCPSALGSINHHPCSPKNLNPKIGYVWDGWDLDLRASRDPVFCGDPCDEEMCFNIGLGSFSF